jgi:hypothetical protein
MIIGLIGQKRVGKDTVASMIKLLYPDFKTIALADPIKDIARIMFNFTEEQLYGNEKEVLDPRWNITPRQVFEQFGTDIMQFDIYKYLPTLETSVPKRKFWVQSLLSHIDINDNVIITDIRGTHELEEIIKFNPSSKFIKIIKPNITMQSTQTSTQTLPQHFHITQLEPNMIDDKFINETIINDCTLEELQEKVKMLFVNKI